MKKYATFNASFKLILKKGRKILMLTESDTGDLDLPGGRIETGEEKLPIKSLFKREVREELGKNVRYKIMGPVVQYRRKNTVTKMNALITAYEAKYLGGKIRLSSEHSKYEWVDLKRFDLSKRKVNNPEERKALESILK